MFEIEDQLEDILTGRDSFLEDAISAEDPGLIAEAIQVVAAQLTRHWNSFNNSSAKILTPIIKTFPISFNVSKLFTYYSKRKPLP